MTLAQFSRFPTKFKDREKLVKDVRFTTLNKSITENGTILFSAQCKNYNTQLEILSNKIHLNTTCKASCTCDSFKYDFAHSLYKERSLLNPENFIKSIESHPKERNEFDVASGCKHIVALVRQAVKG
jgi:hypothetical protein